MKVERWQGREYGTDRPCEIGRLEDDRVVTLAFRYTDEESAWFPTWLGRVGEDAAPVPAGWTLSTEMLDALASAPLRV